MTEVNQVLKKYWGYDDFRPLQRDIINATLDGKDVLALLPTGGGKSICFQVPGLIINGLCIVVSPLIALMSDQVYQLKKRGIAAEYLFSGLNERESQTILENCRKQKIKFLYVSPERLQNDLFKNNILACNVGLIAIDEAHCISQWGYDFRPSYLHITDFRKLFPKINIIALTATATTEVKEDIAQKLSFTNHTIFQKSFTRKNLAYIVEHVDDKFARMLFLLKKISGCAIVYVNTRKKTVDLANFLNQNGISATYYNGGLSTEERDSKQNSWIANQVRVMVATNAFGMGIDKPDVRLVIHQDLPQTLEAYYQEAGRAGRDEQKAYAIVLFNNKDIDELHESVALCHPSITVIRDFYNKLANYLQIPLHNNTNHTCEIDLISFCKKHNLTINRITKILDILEQHGLLSLNSNFFDSSTISAKTSIQSLKSFQNNNPQFSDFIISLMRTYGGQLFADDIKIHEEKLAKDLSLSSDELIKKLTFLSKIGIFNYQQKNNSHQITFITPRTKKDDLPLNKKILDLRANIAKKKARSMQQYVQHRHRCRSQILLEYFGEISYEKCHFCDFCTTKKSFDLFDAFNSHSHIVIDLLQKGPCEIKQIILALNFQTDRDALAVIQLMIEKNLVRYSHYFGLIELVQ